MVVQAGAARRLLDQRPERAGEALLEVEGSGRAALGEMRRLLGLLAEEPDDASLAPQPGLGQLDALVDRVRSAGLPLDLRVAGSPRPLPAGLDLAAYRIVQEALTNVLKHAGAAPTRTLVEYGEHALRLEGGERAGRVGRRAGARGRPRPARDAGARGRVRRPPGGGSPPGRWLRCPRHATSRSRRECSRSGQVSGRDELPGNEVVKGVIEAAPGLAEGAPSGDVRR
jgi:hypothetical protein